MTFSPTVVYRHDGQRKTSMLGTETAATPPAARSHDTTEHIIGREKIGYLFHTQETLACCMTWPGRRRNNIIVFVISNYKNHDIPSTVYWKKKRTILYLSMRVGLGWVPLSQRGATLPPRHTWSIITYILSQFTITDLTPAVPNCSTTYNDTKLIPLEWAISKALLILQNKLTTAQHGTCPCSKIS